MKKRKIGWYWTRRGRNWDIEKWDGDNWSDDYPMGGPPDEIDERRIVRPPRVRK